MPLRMNTPLVLANENSPHGLLLWKCAHGGTAVAVDEEGGGIGAGGGDRLRVNERQWGMGIGDGLQCSGSGSSSDRNEFLCWLVGQLLAM